MTTRSPLPARILIPVANPGTAEELIRLGAAMLDPRAGELSALGIVEVPEGMPLSEGATRARHARRLLQKVLDYAPNGTPIHPIVRIGRHAAEGIIEASAEQERYASKGYNAYWHRRHRIDSDTYVRTTWYAGVYVTEGSDEIDFWRGRSGSSAVAGVPDTASSFTIARLHRSRKLSFGS